MDQWVIHSRNPTPDISRGPENERRKASQNG